MNPAKNVPCAAKGFSVSSISGSDTPYGSARYTTSRVHYLPGGKMKFVKVDGYGEILTYEQITARNLERGYSTRYGRNVCGFRQSRAARKRGYVCTHWSYLLDVKYHTERLAKGK